MSGYAASARLRGGATRFVPIGGSRRLASPNGSVAAAALLDCERIEPVRRPFRERLASRCDDLRETWSQTTFYLFDPESWR